MGPTYVPRLMTTTWGRRLMGTPLLGGAVSVFAKAYAGIVSGSLDCLDSPRRLAASVLPD